MLQHYMITHNMTMLPLWEISKLFQKFLSESIKSPRKTRSAPIKANPIRNAVIRNFGLLKTSIIVRVFVSCFLKFDRIKIETQTKF